MDQCKEFSGFGNATKCLASPQIDFNAEATYIQSEGIADDLGFINNLMIFTPDLIVTFLGLKNYFLDMLLAIL